MKKNYRTLILVALSFFVLQTVVGQESLKESKSKNALKISDYLSKNKQKYELLNTDLEDIRINSEVYSKTTGVTHTYLNQTYKGVKIHNAISTVGIKDNKVFHYANKFKGGIADKINTEAPSLGIQQAIQKVASHFKLGTINNLQLIESKDGKSIFSKGGISQENIPVEQVYFQLPDGSLRLSWDLSIYTLDSNHWWSARVDALTGEILDVNDWVISCSFGGDHTNHGVSHVKKSENTTFSLFKPTSAFVVADGSSYNVFPLPLESPNHGSIGVVTEPADDTASPFGWHDTDGVAGAEYTITRGNNVLAQDDLDANNGSGTSPDGGAGLDFNFSLDINQSPFAYLDVATTNLFYLNNMMHDIWYHHGFDEASGNFQENNYGNGGVAGDHVFADSQDGNGIGDNINNANFATPPDGSNPRMQMFLWFASGPAGDPLTINGGALAGDYTGLPASFGAALTGVAITADMALLTDDDSGASTDPNDACDVVTNAAALSGKIAVIRRGECEFGVKLLAAQNAGAIAVVMVTDDREVVSMGPGAVGDQVTIPGIMIDQTEGEAIITALGNGDTVNASLKDAGPYQRDGSFDNGIIAHEYGHGISTRLTGGAADSGCLNENFQMGEGWSDWFALMLTMNPSDVGTTPRGIGTYAVDEATNGQGIRRRQYTTDMAVNEYTFEATNDNTIDGTDPDTGDPIIRNRGVHYIGTIWCTMLWDLTWAYIDKYGFDPDLINGNAGNNRVMKLVIEGLKLQGCDAEFLEGRDGILAADIALTGGEDQCMIWEVFARRGLGSDANDGFPIRREDQTNGFATPDPSDPSLANCTTLSSDSFTSKDYSVYPNPTSDMLTIKSGKNLGDVTISLIDINGRQVTTKKMTLLGEVELNTSGLKSGLYILNIKGEFINTNEKIIIN